MRYKIDFGPVFLLCILIMIFDRIWALLGNRPEAFAYGRIIYHTVAVISFILTNLSIGIAAAIIFYFMSQLLDKKKNFEIYADFRADTYRLLYAHMMILKEIEQFEELNTREIHADFYYILDAPILIEAFRNINSEEQKLQFKNNLIKYFCNTSDERLDKIMREFEKRIQILENKKDNRYFKGSKDLIESITIRYADDFSIIFGLFKNAKNNTEKHDYVEELVKDYYDVLEATIDLYEELQEFIDSMDKKKLIKFIRMVD